MYQPASEATIALLEAAQQSGIGPAKLRKLLADQKTPGLLPRVSNAPTEAEREKARRILGECERYEVSLISLVDTSYPALLREIPDPPPFLYVRGSISAIGYPCVAVVGTRKASQAGLRAANLIARYLAARGITIVSGLALGIDAAGHEGALSANGITVAILAHGLHIVAPTSHKDLADRILKHNGALISEHAPGVPPNRAEFVRRNRIQSGLSYCSIVVESGVEGGAIHQANFTLRQKRALFTVLQDAPGEASDLNVEGANFLIKTLGAEPLRGTKDLTKVTEVISRRRSSKEPENA